MTNRLWTFASLCGFLSIAAIPSIGVAQPCDSAIANYTVRYVGTDLFEVEAEFARPTNRLDVRFSGATGRPEGQAASVSSLSGWDSDEGEVAIQYVGEGGWSTGDSALSRIRYRLKADHDDVRWTGGGMDEVASHFDDTYFFVGNAFFLIDYDWPACPIQVTFDLPDDWSVMAPWSGDGPDYLASEPMTLGKNAFAMGIFTTGSANADVMTLEWVIDSRLASVEQRIADIMTTVPPVFADYFGGTPTDRYSVVVFQGPHMDGGAFRQSFTLQLSSPIREVDALLWAHGLAHEMLHLWIGNHIMGSSPPDTYWFTEGFTDYLAIKLMYRAGLLSEAMLQQRLANVVRRYRLAARLSPGVGLVEAGQAKHENWELIYGGGAMIAFLLDAENPTGFQRALRELSTNASELFSQQRLLQQLDEFTDGAATRIFEAVDDGMDIGAMVGALENAGLEMTGFAPDEVYIGFPDGCTTADCVPTFLQR